MPHIKIRRMILPKFFTSKQKIMQQISGKIKKVQRGVRIGEARELGFREENGKKFYQSVCKVGYWADSYLDPPNIRLGKVPCKKCKQ